MSSNVKWFEYKTDNLQVLTPIENVKALRIYSTPEKPFFKVSVEIDTYNAELTYWKECETEQLARIIYNNIYAALKHKEQVISFEGWELEAEWKRS